MTVNKVGLNSCPHGAVPVEATGSKQTSELGVTLGPQGSNCPGEKGGMKQSEGGWGVRQF